MTEQAAPVNFNPCVVIPVYRHAATLSPTLAQLKAMNLTCILVNDGGDEQATHFMRELAKAPAVVLCEQFPNQGKGAAVMTGLRHARQLGFSHCLQIDADGQHNAADIPKLLAIAGTQPHALITGVPEYDESVPRHRLYARYLTHFWVWVETLSLRIRDSMCGFRVYPLTETMALLDGCTIGSRMDFDTHIMVRLFWRGVDVVSVPTRVTYPAGGISNFRLWRDNVLITAMHIRLVFGMLLRLPVLLWHNLRGRSR